jgi:hypothetical protein
VPASEILQPSLNCARLMQLAVSNHDVSKARRTDVVAALAAADIADRGANGANYEIDGS